jgi:hypothetical protein
MMENCWEPMLLSGNVEIIKEHGYDPITKVLKK